MLFVIFLTAMISRILLKRLSGFSFPTKIFQMKNSGWIAIAAGVTAVLVFLFLITGRFFVEYLGWLLIPVPKHGKRQK
jgi:hypothetical protein